MSIVLNHTIVPSTDIHAAADFYARVFDIRRVPSPGPFTAVRVNDDLTLDFAAIRGFESHHYAFLVSDEVFDAIFARIRKEEIPFTADPQQKEIGALNHRDGGRGFYFRDLDGHLLELLTRT